MTVTHPPVAAARPAAHSASRDGAVAAHPRIYYLHPLLAGPVAAWPRHMERVAALGFSHVLLAPPFLPGRAGNIFLVADHDRLHPALGGGDARAALDAAAQAARAHGLALLLDLVVDRVACDAAIVAAHPDWFAGHGRDDPPDPRVRPDLREAALTRFGAAPDAQMAAWSALLVGWLDAGVAGFRCDAAHNVPASFWRPLIARARAQRHDARFIAWTLGAAPPAIAALAGVGFDFAASSSFAWDFRAGWLADDLRRIAPLGRPLAMSEAPFGARVSDPAAALRALRFAAGSAAAWLMPMGFEFGARRPLDPARGRPEDFAALAGDPPHDCTDEVVAVNDLHAALADQLDVTLISAPGDAVAAVLRAPPDAAGRGALLLANARLDRPVQEPASRLLPRLDGRALSDAGRDVAPDAVIALDAGEVRLLPTRPARPILLQDAATRQDAAAAMRSPRIAIEAVSPAVDDGRFPVKRRLGETVTVQADVICDGHDRLAVALLWRTADAAEWQQTRMRPLGNDRWAADFPLARLGRHCFTIEAWKDVFASFHEELAKKHAAGNDVALELREGIELVARAGLDELATRLRGGDEAARLSLLLSDDTAARMAVADKRPFRVRLEPGYPVDAERTAAGFAAWYELFPRSMSDDESRHGTFDDVIAHLPRVRDMGFDVLYFPPIHPIGRVNRKGRNNALHAAPDDPGSPYAIGSAEGGHDAVHPELGTLDDFRRLIEAAGRHGIEIAIDFAIQCAPDHPWLRQHPEWFNWRPDGSIRYAENPPKKYEDIVNVEFYAGGAAAPALWTALRDIVLFWLGQGVRTFRVDNPHTKPLPFWEWLIGSVRARHPDAIFLAEAFTRPKVMYRLAKVGFSQSYSYFTWREAPWEFREYLTELGTAGPREFFRPNFFVNTPDINPIYLNDSGRAGFLIRAALAATLSGLWGLYSGFELCEARALPGREEYLDSEKYQLRAWDWERPGNIVAEVAALNRIRRANPALHSHLGVSFLPCDNDRVLCFVKVSASGDNVVVGAISSDPAGVQQTRFRLVG